MGGNVLDVGTGSGCLAVTLKLERPNWFVAACDISPTAVRVARENARTLGAIVIVKQGDLFEPFRGTKFGVVVCNPPYIDPSSRLMPEVGEWEPPEALFAKEGGLAVYRRLAEEAPEHMMGWGRLIVELGDGMVEPVKALFEARGWELTAMRPDLGGTPRAAVFQLSG
jgi:release factor glutamine methyltransferase